MASKVDTDDISKEESSAILVNDLLNRLQSLDLECSNQHKYKMNVTTVPDWLKDVESPFLWHSQEERGLGSEQVISRSLEKVHELSFDEPGFSLQRFISLMKLALEYYITGEKQKSKTTMVSVEEFLEKAVFENDASYQKVMLSLGHVISSMQAHFLALDGEEEKSRKLAEKIIPVKIMTTHDQANIYAMKARFFIYSGYENGESIGVKFARQALELEPENAEWEYLLAKLLRQQRKEEPFSMDIPKEELVLLEKAVERCKNAKYLVYLAQVYRECATQAFKQYRDKPGFFTSDLYLTIQGMTKKALNLYKEVLELEPTSPAALRRIGYGIMNLDRKVADYDLALKCLLKSLELCPENLMTLHVLGTYYHRYGKDNKKALEYFELCAKRGSQAGLTDMIRVKFWEDPNYDPRADLETGLKMEIKKKNRAFLLVQLGGYYLLIKRDFQKSLEYFNQVLVEDKDCTHMQTFKSLFLRMYTPINLNKCLANEALLILQKESSSNTTQDVSQSSAKDFLSKSTNSHPELLEIIPDPLFIDQLFETSKEIQDKENSKRNHRNHSSQEYRNNHRSDYQRRSRPNQLGRGGRGGRGYSNNRRPSPEDSSERRGRFSYVNKGDTDQGAGFESRGRFTRGDQRNRSQDYNDQCNWRQKPNRDQNQPNDEKQNWRK